MRRRSAIDGREEKWREGGRPVGWSAWQEEKSHGTFTWDRDAGCTAKGAAGAANVAGGCFLQSYAVEPGQRYAVRAVRRLQGHGDAWLRVRWQTADAKWAAEGLDVLLYCDAPAEQWGDMFGVVEVPAGVNKLLVLLGVAGQRSADDAAWFDDVAVYRLP